MLPQEWRRTAEPGGEIVQVWAAWLDLPDHELKRLERTLSPDEHGKASRFVFERDRRTYVAARGILRQILGLYLERAPEALTFEYNDQGKPSLTADCGGNGLHFNVSHSGLLAVYAVRSEGSVGIDIELVRNIEDMNRIAASTFSALENDTFQSLPVAERAEAFFNCWTRKEAFIKAVGSGLSYPLSDFDVTLRPHEPARFLRIMGEAVQEWSLVDLRPAEGYIGAVAVPTSAIQVRLNWWDVCSERQVSLN